ncbi:MAG: hypothetical protein P8Y29_03020 [Gemmatimonadota bacterium]|jgi:hypothetical protein
MDPVFGIVALVISVLFLAGMVTVLVLLRKGEGPTFSANREYDANRREAVRILTGAPVDHVPGGQWYRPDRNRVMADDPVADRYRKAIGDALGAVIPEERGLIMRDDGTASVGGDQTRIVPAVSTADLRDSLRSSAENGGGLVIGLVLFNPEPPGGDARHVALSVQILFPALENAGRGDLIREFEQLAALETAASTE